jgi:hypothetical protein
MPKNKQKQILKKKKKPSRYILYIQKVIMIDIEFILQEIYAACMVPLYIYIYMLICRKDTYIYKND